MALAVGRATRKSAELLGAAADAGDTEAQFALGLLYLLGRGDRRRDWRYFWRSRRDPW